MDVTYFSSTDEFRQWLPDNHTKEQEILVGFYKVSTGKPSMTWSESVDVALCFGWIDGIRRSIDSESYCIRFTPRNPKSIWSNVNIDKVEKLIQNGQMTEAGLAIYNQRQNEKSGIYSFENDNRTLDNELETMFSENTPAWNFFINIAPSYRKTAIHWVMSAKQRKTQFSRLEKLIQLSSEGKRIY